MNKSRRTELRYVVVKEVIADGVKVLPGDYSGYKIELGVPLQGQTVWQKPEYYLVLPGDGRPFLSIEVVVTEHINSSAILILGG